MACSKAANGFSRPSSHAEDRDALAAVWAEGEIDVVIHLAGQAGVRYSIDKRAPMSMPIHRYIQPA